MKKILIIVGLLVFLTLLFILSNHDELPQARLFTVSLGTVDATVSNTRAGTIKACQRSRLSMRTGGLVNHLSVKEGDKVNKNQVLLELWNKDKKALLSQAEAQLNATILNRQQICTSSEYEGREAKRLESLATKNLTSVEIADSAKTQAEASQFACESAQANVEMSKSNTELQKALLDLTILRAPFDGIIAKINGEIGEYITPSPPGVPTPPAVDIINLDCLYVSAPIDEVDAKPIKRGLNVNITLDAFRDEVFPGHVKRIAPYVVDKEKQARTVDVEVEFSQISDQRRLLIGYSADITIILETHENVLRIPTEAIMDGNKVLVFSTESSLLSEQTINTGLSNWSYTEVLSGLKAGDQVVTSLDIPGIKAGAKVTTTQIENQ